MAKNYDEKDKEKVNGEAEENTSETISPEEQMIRRQSAPRPTAESEAQRLYEAQKAKMMQGQGMSP
jgi:hypothetical protein